MTPTPPQAGERAEALDAARRVVAAFKALGLSDGGYSQMQRHQECEAAMTALEAAIAALDSEESK